MRQVTACPIAAEGSDKKRERRSSDERGAVRSPLARALPSRRLRLAVEVLNPIEFPTQGFDLLPQLRIVILGGLQRIPRLANQWLRGGADRHRRCDEQGAADDAILRALRVFVALDASDHRHSDLQ
jgi:hypothetical protein